MKYFQNKVQQVVAKSSKVFSKAINAEIVSRCQILKPQEPVSQTLFSFANKEVLRLLCFFFGNLNMESLETSTNNLSISEKRQNFLPWHDYFMAVAFLSSQR